MVIKIGCDPELEIRSKNGERRYASEYGYGGYSKIGDDVGGVLEIRPGAYRYEDELVDALEEILKEIDVGKAGVYTWGRYAGIGGHLHISGKNVGSTNMKRAIRWFIGKRFDDINGKWYRVRGSYRDIYYFVSNSSHLQYKSPPAYWMKDDFMALITLRILRLIGENRDIEIGESYYPDMEDYIRLGLTEAETKYFMGNTEKFDGRVIYMDVREMWGIKESENVEFSGYFPEWFKKRMKEIVPVYDRMYLSGLKKERGDVFTVVDPADGCSASSRLVQKARKFLREAGLEFRRKEELGIRFNTQYPVIALPRSWREDDEKLEGFVNFLEG